MAESPPPTDVIEQIPDPAILNLWLAESIQRSDLLRALLRVARRKSRYARSRPDAHAKSSDGVQS